MPGIRDCRERVRGEFVFRHAAVSLRQWGDTLEEAARAATEGDYRTRGDALKRMRKPVSGI